MALPTQSNNRIHYAVHNVGFAPDGTSGYLEASGVQSVGLNTTFNLEQVFQLGQLDVYENIENIPDIEVTIEKVVDGAQLLQHLGTQNATKSGLVGRYSNEKAMLAMSFYDDTWEGASGTTISANGPPLSMVVCSGVYVGSITLTLPVEGNCTESVTFVGNDKQWKASPVNDQAGVDGSGIFNFFPNPNATNTNESPWNQAVAGSGVQRRQDVDMDNSLWPEDIPGITANTGVNTDQGTKFNVAIQTVTVNVDLGRTELFELGRRGPYHRFIELPTEVTCAIEVIEKEFGDFVDAVSTGDNISDQKISIYLANDHRIDLGVKNRLASITSTGGDTGGGNRTTTYNYTNFNSFTCVAKSDPAALGY